jgi:hypothetical protein
VDRKGFRGAQRREFVGQVRVAELHHPFGPGQIPQRVRAEVGQRDIGRELVDHHQFGRGRQHRLPAVSQVAKPGGAVDRRSDVVALVAKSHLAGVDPDA